MAEILVFNERAGNFNPRKHNPELIANFLEAAGIVGIQVISLSQWLDWVNRSYNALSFVYQFLPEEEWKDKISSVEKLKHQKPNNFIGIDNHTNLFFLLPD